MGTKYNQQNPHILRVQKKKLKKKNTWSRDRAYGLTIKISHTPNQLSLLKWKIKNHIYLQNLDFFL